MAVTGPGWYNQNIVYRIMNSDHPGPRAGIKLTLLRRGILPAIPAVRIRSLHHTVERPPPPGRLCIHGYPVSENGFSMSCTGSQYKYWNPRFKFSPLVDCHHSAGVKWVWISVYKNFGYYNHRRLRFSQVTLMPLASHTHTHQINK
jgi:hypothetical protein